MFVIGRARVWYPDRPSNPSSGELSQDINELDFGGTVVELRGGVGAGTGAGALTAGPAASSVESLGAGMRLIFGVIAYEPGEMISASCLSGFGAAGTAFLATERRINRGSSFGGYFARQYSGFCETL